MAQILLLGTVWIWGCIAHADRCESASPCLHLELNEGGGVQKEGDECF